MKQSVINVCVKEDTLDIFPEFLELLEICGCSYTG